MPPRPQQAPASSAASTSSGSSTSGLQAAQGATRSPLQTRQRLNNLWGLRRTQFEDVLPEGMRGRALLLKIDAACAAAGNGKILNKQRRIAQYSIRLSDTSEPITVLRRVDEFGLADLRRVDAQRSAQDVLHQMELSATKAMGHAMAHIDPQSRQLNGRLRHLWTWSLSQEFEAEFKAHQAKEPGVLPARFLMHLSALCDQAGHAKRLVEDPPIDKFSIRPTGAGEAITVLRRLNELGLADLRKLEPGADETAVLDTMRVGARKAAPKTLKPMNIDPEVKKRLKAAWKGPRRKEFEAVADTIGGIGPSGVRFMLLLSAECDRAGGGKVMDAARKIEKFSIRPKEAAGPITVMRRTDALGLADMRLVGSGRTAPAVLAEMQSSVMRSVIRLKRSRPAPSEPAPKRIKQEPAVTPRAPVLVQRDLDMARTAWLREIDCCDLVGDTAQWSVTLNETDAVIVRHPMQPDPAKDDEFPLRDPHDPQQVHKRYATAEGRCHPQVQVLKVAVSPDMRRYMRDLAKTDPFDRLMMSQRELSAAFRGIEADVEQEMKRLIANRPHPQPRCETRELGPQDVEPHESLLIGQQGLFALKYPDTPEPTFRNGRILGLFSGALLEAEHEYAEQQERFPDMDDYALGVASITLSPLGHANSMAFANTSLDPNAQNLAYAQDKINALFLPLNVTLTDKNGRPTRQPMTAVVALDNLFAYGESAAQVRLHYGDSYLSRMAGKLEAAQAAPRIQVKAEPADPQDPNRAP